MATEVDLDSRQNELDYQNDMYTPFEFSDAGLKDGKIGWFCSNCKGLIIKNAVFYADECKASDGESGGSSTI